MMVAGDGDYEKVGDGVNGVGITTAGVERKNCASRGPPDNQNFAHPQSRGSEVVTTSDLLDWGCASSCAPGPAVGRA